MLRLALVLGLDLGLRLGLGRTLTLTLSGPGAEVYCEGARAVCCEGSEGEGRREDTYLLGVGLGVGLG